MDSSPDGLRAAVLAGQGAGVDPWRDFLFAPSQQALAAWFGHPPIDIRAAIDSDIVALEAMISEQVDAILHHPRFLALEGRWRAVFWLARLAAAEGWRRRVLFMLLPVTWAEIARDQERAADFDQSQMFQKIYEETYGQAGGRPFGLIVVDHELQHLRSTETGVDDVATVQLLSQTGAAAFVPFIFAASPALLGLMSFEQLERVHALRPAFSDQAHQRWNTLMDRLDSRFIGITLPRVLIRPPWTDDAPHGLPFRYNEYAPDSADRVWVSAGFAFAAVVARAFAQHSWPADVRGADPDREGGGVVTRLPVEWFRSDLDGYWPRLPLEVQLTTEQERDLIEAGLMPVGALPYGSEPLFEVTRSLFRPGRYAGPNAAAAEANAMLSAQINSVLCASRFAHHLKIMARDMVGSVTTAEALERRLQDWLNQYVNPNLSAGAELLAKYPLAEGLVTVTDMPDRPGEYRTAIYLRPHYQLDDIRAVLALDMTVKQEAA
nr:type VI secretion system contractile sheath large subunit [uncultured Rhodopila sp.]